MTTLFLVDNSVIQRLAKPPVLAAWSTLADRGEIATCLPTMLEAGYSARSASDHHTLLRMEQVAKIFLPPEVGIVQIAIQLQSALFDAGMGRAVGVSDLQIAATALHHTTEGRPVIIAHYDADFDHLSAVDPRIRTEWIVPRGTVD